MDFSQIFLIGFDSNLYSLLELSGVVG